jgi:hypothetical protein
VEFGIPFAECDILDSKFTQGILDTQFIAARTDVSKAGFKVYG